MPDYRTRRQKLEAMAAQAESPHEASVAREKLKKMGVDPDEPMGRKTRPKPDYGQTYDYEDLKKTMDEFLKTWEFKYTTPKTDWSNFYRNMYGQFDYKSPRHDPRRDEGKSDNEVRFVGGPSDGQVHADPRTAEWRVLGPSDFKTFWKAELDDIPLPKDGAYSREVDGEGKPFYLWRGWKKR